MSVKVGRILDHKGVKWDLRLWGKCNRASKKPKWTSLCAKMAFWYMLRLTELVLRPCSEILTVDVSLLTHCSVKAATTQVQRRKWKFHENNPMWNLPLDYGNVCTPQPYVAREQRRLCSGPAWVCLPYLRNVTLLRLISAEIINFYREPRKLLSSFGQGSQICYSYTFIDTRVVI
jgi:hypothetical protein